MTNPTFIFDAEANGYISESVRINGSALVHIELESRAPIVILKMCQNGEYANYGQPPKSATGFELTVHTKKEETVRLATPVQVTKCYILN